LPFPARTPSSPGTPRTPGAASDDSVVFVPADERESPLQELSPASSPRPQRLPPSRQTWPSSVPTLGLAVHPAALQPQCVSRLRLAAAPTPARCYSRQRSRGLPPPHPAAGAGQAVADPSFVGVCRAVGDFYSELLKGSRCTGPDALAVDERFVEIDLSGEFPPERREAQVDPTVAAVPAATRAPPMQSPWLGSLGLEGRRLGSGLTADTKTVLVHRL